MKKLFDDSEFEKIIGKKLDEYESNPDDTMKSRIFARINGQKKISSRTYYLSSALIGLVLSLAVVIWQLNYDHDQTSVNETNFPGNNKLTENRSKSSKKELSLSNQAFSDNYSTSEDKQNIKATGNIPPIIHQSNDQVIHTKKSGNMAGTGRVLHRLPVLAIVPSLILDSDVKLSNSINYTAPLKGSEIIKKTKAPQLGYYANMITFWNFQKAIPNTNDDWIVQNMESSGRFSPERMGFRVDAGINMLITDNIEVYAGLSSYFQQYHSLLKIRPSKADSLMLNETTGNLQPSFNESSVDINKNVWSVGSKLGIRYYLPQGNKNFWLSPSVDYQHTLTNLGSAHFDLVQDQFYMNIEFGWSKQITKNILFNFSPIFTYSFIERSTQQSLIAFRPHSWGINFGLKYQFIQ